MAFIKTFPISLFLFLSTLFFLLFSPSSHHRHRHRNSSIPHRSLLPLLPSPPPPPPHPDPNCSHVFHLPAADRCAFSLSHCHGDSNGGLLNYASLHFCLFSQNSLLSIPALSLLLLSHFYFLVQAAGRHFSPVVSALSSHLRLSPSMGAVTLLALGNGAPDVFASIAAVRSGHARTGLGAILSAGAFVSAFVVGFVAIHAAPFSVDPAPFVRDVFFYLLAASALFYVYLSAEIYLWQAVGFVAFYLFFVVFVFWLDLGEDDKKLGGGGGGIGREEIELGLAPLETVKKLPKLTDASQSGDATAGQEEAKSCLVLCQYLRKIPKAWEVPVSTLLKLTIPSISPSNWSRFYCSANITLCPLALLCSFNSFIPLDHKIVFLIPQSRYPIWLITLFVSFTLGLAHYILERDPPETESILTTLIAFIMSVFWISTMAGELLNCLAAIGTIMNLPPALLGLTVLAWGNSVGDLVADVAVAKAGQPAMAMAGCFAGPMFNMLVGLGMALVIETASVYPGAYELRFHVSIVVAFVFLLLTLMGSLLVVTWFRFRVTRFWGFCLVGLYVLFMVTSIAIAKFSG